MLTITYKGMTSDKNKFKKPWTILNPLCILCIVWYNFYFVISLSSGGSIQSTVKFSSKFEEENPLSQIL